MAFVGTGYSWLRTLFANVGAANKAKGLVTLIGAGRMGYEMAGRLAKDGADILIRDDELLVGAPTKHLRGANPGVEQLPIHLAVLLDRVEVTTGSEVTVTQFAEEDRQYLREAAEYWKDKYPAKRSFEIENALEKLPEHLQRIKSQ